MALVAKTDILHGKDDEVIEIRQGEEVRDLPSDVVKQLKAQKLVGEPAPTASQSEENEDLEQENEELAAQVEELQKQLEEARKSSGNSGDSGSKTDTKA